VYLGITHIHFQESVGWLGGASQGHQTNTATLIYCFTAQWNHCFDDYCARRPHYDEQMLPQYSTVLRQDQTFRRLLIQTSVPWVCGPTFCGTSFIDPSPSLWSVLLEQRWSTPSLVCVQLVIPCSAPTSRTFFVVCAFAICSQPPSRCPW
jgi:hypothetical protein